MSKRPSEQFMEVEQQLKKARVVGMKAQAAQIAIQTIQAKNSNVAREFG